MSIDVLRLEGDNAFLVQQAVEQAIGRQRRIEQFVILDGCRQNARALPILIHLVDTAGVVGFGRRRQMLDHEAAGTPAPRAIARRRTVTRNGEADVGRQLGRLAVVVV